MLFDHCASCQRCCNVDAGEPALDVTLTSQEQKQLGSICIERQCTHLGPKGCTLGHAKPFSCSLYPLAYDPSEKQYYFDAECPLHPSYVEQLADANSEASQHLRAMHHTIQTLSQSEPAFLEENFEIDVAYFDLAPISHPISG